MRFKLRKLVGSMLLGLSISCSSLGLPGCAGTQIPVVVPAPSCILPAAPSWPPPACTEIDPDVCTTYYLTKAGLYIRDAERVVAALASCRGIVWRPYA